MNIIKLNDFVHITFSDGKEYTNAECEEALWEYILENQDDEEAIKSKVFNSEENTDTCYVSLDRIKASNVLTLRGNSVYMLDVSELSIPQDLIVKILEAEENEDWRTINKYKNFWTLISLNPDSRVRNNIFWFIRKWGMQITDSGLIIAYRNAVLKKENNFTVQEVKDIINDYYYTKFVKNEEPSKELTEKYNLIINEDQESPIFTDAHSRTTTIKLGTPVSIPRSECDADQEHSCSRGLHVGAKGWLKSNYFGDVGLMVLVNPANIVAVPTIDEYGKMRTCEYFPIAIIDFDSNGDIVEKPYSLHNDVAYLKNIKYRGTINNNDIDNYEVINQYETREDLYNSILERLSEN
jgi:hypothetical protein